MSYGTIAHELMKPVFEASTCEGFKNDFYRHDLAFLQATAVPGIEYLWHIRPTGTHLIVLGIRTEENQILETLQRANDPTLNSLHKIEVTYSGCRVTPITHEQGILMAGQKPDMTASIYRDIFGKGPTQITISKGETVVATASLNQRYVQQDNRGWVATISSEIHGHHRVDTAIRAILMVEDAVTKALGTLFWKLDSHTVNNEAQAVWCARITEFRSTPESHLKLAA